LSIDPAGGCDPLATWWKFAEESLSNGAVAALIDTPTAPSASRTITTARTNIRRYEFTALP